VSENFAFREQLYNFQLIVWLVFRIAATKQPKFGVANPKKIFFIFNFTFLRRAKYKF
jgi:hypothetical protein